MPPTNESPAPVGSTTRCYGKAGAMKNPLAVETITPCLPFTRGASMKWWRAEKQIPISVGHLRLFRPQKFNAISERNLGV